ncbi:MAG: hypothetical protein GY839_11125 [candidate division Zixibacteria bacterium]|nr:hypothetical protein [candidate division Zixibacteria bacterium]
MMKKITVIVLISIIAFIGCSVEENPVEPPIPSGTMFRGFVNSTSLDENITDEPSGRPVFVYEPLGYEVTSLDSFEIYIDTTYDGVTHYDTTYLYYIVTSTEYPTLYLLHGYGGSYTYYSDLFLLKDILDEMISTGEIEPMIVVTPDCNNSFGGSFYTNSPEINSITDDGDTIFASYAANFEDFVTTDLLDYMSDRFSVDTVAAMRGISGHSMGGYGAMKLAMKYPELFGSVSSMSAPLAFPYLQGLLPAVFAENGFTPGDAAGFYAISPSAEKRVTSMMFAMGAAFSPHDELDDDTTYFHRTRNVDEFEGIDLPFGIDGQLAETSPVWLNWLANDPLSMLVAGGYASSLGNSAVYIDCGQYDDLGLHLHAEEFHNALTTIGIPHTYEIYAGYSEGDADHTKYIGDRLREILKFHNDAFNQAQ